MTAAQQSRAEFEERFRRAGLPLLIEDRDASRDIWTRAAGLLALVFWVELLGALNLDWEWWANVLTIVAGLALLAAAWAIANRVRGRSPFARPEDIGTLELAGFVIVPALLPLIFNQQPVSALVTALGNLALLGLIYGVTALGLWSIVRWAARRLFGQLASSLTLVARALPLLLLFSVVLFMTTEIWQVFADMNPANLRAVSALLVIVGAVFLVVRLPREVSSLEREAAVDPPLAPAQRVNVGLVLFVSQALQVLAVTLAVAAFYVAYGMIAISPAVAETWTGAPVDQLVDGTLLGVDYTISEQLLYVALAIGTFSGFYYAISVFTDNEYRREFLGEVTDEMRETFELRADYLMVIGARSA